MIIGTSGCSIYRKYKQPDMKTVTDSLFRHTQEQTDTASIAALSWREIFTDSQLQQLIDTGLKNNTDLNIARLKVKEAEALLMTSRLSYLPSISLSPQGTLNKAEKSKLTKSYNLAVSADWEIDIFGRVTNAKREAKAVLEQSEAYRQAVQTQLVATIANSYYTLLMLDEQLEISRRTAENWSENLRVMKALKKAGQTTDMAVAQTEARRLLAFDRTSDYRDGECSLCVVRFDSGNNIPFDFKTTKIPGYTFSRHSFAIIAPSSRCPSKRGRFSCCVLCY